LQDVNALKQETRARDSVNGRTSTEREEDQSPHINLQLSVFPFLIRTDSSRLESETPAGELVLGEGGVKVSKNRKVVKIDQENQKNC
jgi:hypothetical protein